MPTGSVTYVKDGNAWIPVIEYDLFPVNSVEDKASVFRFALAMAQINMWTANQILPSLNIVPLKGPVTSEYGSVRDYVKDGVVKKTAPHTGIDIDGRMSDPVSAVGPGRVIFAGWINGYGNTVKIDHGLGYVTAYSHLSNISVATGSYVSRGLQVGLVGNTGFTSAGPGDGSHLHFELERNGVRLNPATFVPALNDLPRSLLSGSVQMK